MEILFELLLYLLQPLAEIALQLIFELFVELGMRSMLEIVWRPKPLHPVLAGIGYAFLGAIAGGISLSIFPHSFIATPWMRVANLLVSPLAAGAVMVAFGAWRQRNDQQLIRLNRFGYGFLFAFVMTFVRFIWAT